MLISLKRLIELASEDIISGVFSTFRCKHDLDIESFLKEKAVLFDKKGKSKTHLLLDEDELMHGNIVIAAYFSNAIQSLKIPESISMSQIRRLDGLYSKRGGEQISEVPSYLIGQLAKNDSYKNQIDGSLVLEYAMSVISSAEHLVGGRVVYIECRDIPILITFYESSGFKLLRRDPNDALLQMYCIIGN